MREAAERVDVLDFFVPLDVLDFFVPLEVLDFFVPAEVVLEVPLLRVVPEDALFFLGATDSSLG